MIQVINVIFINEHYNYNMKLGETKIRLSLYVKKAFFRDLFIKISLFILK